MKTLSFGHDTEHGLACIVIAGEKSDKKMVVLCHLSTDDSEPPSYLNQIKPSDCGHDLHPCIITNKPAFEFWGENRCMTALFNAAKNNGIDVVGY